MKIMDGPIGLYIHIPFCASKCPYCDFYSLTGQTPEVMDGYTDALIRSLGEWSARLEGVLADTLYFGGGTPSLLGSDRLARIMEAARRRFGLENAEITLEANPGDELYEVFSAFSAAGGNRVSLGMQSADEGQLAFLGRRHRPQDVSKAVESARSAGIGNISLDLMLGLPGQTVESIVSAVSEAVRLDVRHISAYMLKIEDGTPFYSRRDSLSLPDDDRVAELYLAACQTMEMFGYKQYEISNYAKPGFESRHNLKYWKLDPYLGIGAAAHSFLDGKRFYYPHDVQGFIDGVQPLPERQGENNKASSIEEAGEQEYMMLRLRLAEGLNNEEFSKRFGHPIPSEVYERAGQLPQQLLTADPTGIRLNRFGFLLSNTVISHLIG